MSQFHRLQGQDAAQSCWRVAAIYRCCLRLGMGREWAAEKIYAFLPEGSREAMLDSWFTDMDALHAYYRAKILRAAEARGLMDFTMMAA